MSGLEKAPQDMLEYYPAVHEHGAFGSYPQAQYGPHAMYHPGYDSGDHNAEYQYMAAHHYSQPPVYSPESQPMMGARPGPQPAPEVYHIQEQPNIPSGPAPQNARKRRASPSLSEYDVAPPQKKQNMTQVHVQDPNGEYYDFSGHPSPYSPYVQTPAAHNGLQAPIAVNSPKIGGHHYSTSTASQVSLAAPSPHTPAWSPSFTTVKTEQSPRPPMTPAPRPTSVTSPLKSSMPKLVRTSTIQQSPPGLGTSMVPAHTQIFNPYAMLPLKASLKLKGDLNSMIKDWTPDEREARRRLVEFKRSQTGSTITAEFKPVAPQDRAPSSITISCILWKEKKEYYVTSVDTIYLLEALVGVRFTVEEKNRIRRNLEGFRPATVSKSKIESEDFFKVIMGFPHPKPRNIEKDVKVFPWSILALALKKIISKYSASYSSTASALLTPAASGYASTESSAEYAYPPSPQLAASNAMPYPGINTVSYHPGPIPGRMSAPATAAPLQELQVQVPPIGPGYEMQDPYGFSTMPGMPHATMSMVPQPMSAPVTRMPQSWDFAGYMNGHPGHTAPSSAPPIAYNRGPIETAEFMPPSNYQLK